MGGLLRYIWYSEQGPGRVGTPAVSFFGTQCITLETVNHHPRAMYRNAAIFEVGRAFDHVLLP